MRRIWKRRGRTALLIPVCMKHCTVNPLTSIPICVIFLQFSLISSLLKIIHITNEKLYQINHPSKCHFTTSIMQNLVLTHNIPGIIISDKNSQSNVMFLNTRTHSNQPTLVINITALMGNVIDFHEMHNTPMHYLQIPYT